MQNEILKIFFLFVIFFMLPNFAKAATYYAAPNGSGNACLSSSPCALSGGISKTLPGDTLILKNGTYNEQLAPDKTGTIGNYITFQAENRGQAIIQRVTDGSAINIYSTPSNILSYIIIDGIAARSRGEYPAIALGGQDGSAESEMGHDIIVRNCSAFGSAVQLNVVAFDISRIRDSLIEDSWSYGPSRKSMQLYGAVRMTVRRFVARYDYWDGGSYKPNDPRMSFAIYNSKDGIYENIIALDMAPDPPARFSASKASFAIEGNLGDTVLFEGSTGNSWLGIISLHNNGTGLYSSGVAASVKGGPNDGNIVQDFLIWDNTALGINLQQQNHFNNFTSGTLGKNSSHGIASYSTTNTDDAFDKIFFNANGGKAYHINSGINITFTNSTGINSSNTYDSPNFNEAYALGLNYLVSPDMVNGFERGGAITKRYENGFLSNNNLWPWPNENLIRLQMCNPDDLVTSQRVATNGQDWEPAWCASGKTFTRHIWEYLGNTIPCEIYGTCSGDATPPAAPSGLSVL